MRHIAETIWQQLNMKGASLPMSWGAHALKTLPEGRIDNDFDCQQGGLQFMVHGALFKGHVRVILDYNDTYTVHIGRARAGKWKEHLMFQGVYGDMLAGVVDTAVETAPVAADCVNEDTPEYGGHKRADLEQFIMDDDNPMTCPMCGARSTIEEEYDNGEQLHFCENDYCLMGHFLAVEPEDEPKPLYNDALIDWDTAQDAEVRGVVESIDELTGDGECLINDEKPEFFSIYVREGEGTSMVVGDYDTLEQANEALVAVLADHPNVVVGPKSLWSAKTRDDDLYEQVMTTGSYEQQADRMAQRQQADRMAQRQQAASQDVNPLGHLGQVVSSDLIQQAMAAASAEIPHTNLENELREAYFTLWYAVENGIDNDTFFKLRETFRGIQALVEADDSK